VCGSLNWRARVENALSMMLKERFPKWNSRAKFHPIVITPRNIDLTAANR
jgi:hypothetical protein